MNRLIWAVLLVGVMSMSTARAQTAEEQAEFMTETRQGLLHVVAMYFGPMVAMAREQMPYNGSLVRANAGKISTLLPMIPDVFRMDTRAFDVETEALDELWDNLDDIADKASNATAAAEALAAAADEGQGAAMQAVQKLGAACKACHDEYREEI